MPNRMTADRRNDILDAALLLLRTGGLPAVTTAALARDARCSKDTLYLLFRDRDAILAALVERQAGQLNATMQAVDPSASARDGLIAAGTRLLELLTSDASLAINRAALADQSGALSRILIETGKNRSAPRLIALIEQMRAQGDIAAADVGEAYATFYGLLVGDRQILALHRVQGTDRDDCEAVARRAVQRFVLIYSGERSRP
ncbi:TetR/AcrR family transcriptional regulator [Phreatobacter stygius]|uniref:TetR/AcrR family transcriptional regulator n=1 Tax=Phreatobacter stygius TaxID=1940610 RepID=A0A4D7AY33_9HYPH|nr:TetR/AcrR family transcriptional regulator [Phreatobacter stygius]QCI65131.1 TetR/AcrR family transcriptional regulator [Phreatobacter stygius]